MKKKMLRFSTSDGEQWDLPKEIPARNRAEYYAKKDKDTTFQQEFDWVMDDDFEAIDWLQNNMDHEEYAPFLIHVSKPTELTFIEKWAEDESRGIREVSV